MVTRSEASAGFNAASEVTKIKRARGERRRKGRNYKSKLKPFRLELVSLYHEGASYEDLAYWLKTQKKVSAHSTTVMRYLYGLPELVRRNG